MSVGTNIKKRRYELRMSQQELADALGYKTRSTIAKIESGENDISHSKLIKFAEVLDTTVEFLISDNSDLVSLTHLAQANMDSADSRSHPRTAAVVLAGGKSSRNRQNIPNQFINIHGKPVVVYCLEAYQAHPSIDDIYVVCLKGWEQIMSAYAKRYQITKLRGLIPAGQSGIMSIRNSLNHMEDKYNPDDIVIFQESTRPMINVDMISKLLQHVYENGHANTSQSMKDILQFTQNYGKTSYVDRNSIVEVQSPDAYRFEVIRAVFDKAKEQQHPLTESCCAMLMHNLGLNVNFFEGGTTNYKIIRQEDIAIVMETLRGKG